MIRVSPTAPSDKLRQRMIYATAESNKLCLQKRTSTAEHAHVPNVLCLQSSRQRERNLIIYCLFREAEVSLTERALFVLAVHQNVCVRVCVHVCVCVCVCVCECVCVCVCVC